MHYSLMGKMRLSVIDSDILIDWCLTSSEQFFSYIQDEICYIEVPFMAGLTVYT